MAPTLRGRLSALAALLGFLLVAALAGAGYALVSTIRTANESLATYADELVLAWQLQEAFERKLATGRGYLLAHDETAMAELERASADGELVMSRLHARVKSKEGIVLLDETEQALHDHDRALRDVMAMNASRDDVSQAWATHVRGKAIRARQDMDAFIHHKERLLDDGRVAVLDAQQRAAWMIGSAVLVALILAFFGASRVLGSSQRRTAAEREARADAERERAFLYNLLDQLPFGVVAADPTGNVMHVNRFAKTTGEDENAPWEGPLQRALRGTIVTQEELRSASERTYSVTAGPVRDEAGAIIAAVVAFSDVSKRKRAEKERELFIGALGHDLRNPLHAILVSADSLMQRNDVPDAARKQATRIVTSANKMNDLIRDLLDFARSQHGAIPIKREVCELSEIAADVTAEIKLAQPGRDIRVESQAECTGQWDRPRMTQVLQNLIANAVQHGDDAPITVQTECDADQVRAMVSNRGTIPTEDRPRIFEPFRARSNSKGLGLGLYIARAIVEAHGGTIAVESADNYTAFVVTLPRGLRLDSEPRRTAPTR